VLVKRYLALVLLLVAGLASPAAAANGRFPRLNPSGSAVCAGAGAVQIVTIATGDRREFSPADQCHWRTDDCAIFHDGVRTLEACVGESVPRAIGGAGFQLAAGGGNWARQVDTSIEFHRGADTSVIPDAGAFDVSTRGDLLYLSPYHAQEKGLYVNGALLLSGRIREPRFGAGRIAWMVDGVNYVMRWPVTSSPVEVRGPDLEGWPLPLALPVTEEGWLARISQDWLRLSPERDPLNGYRIPAPAYEPDVVALDRSTLRLAWADGRGELVLRDQDLTAARTALYTSAPPPSPPPTPPPTPAPAPQPCGAADTFRMPDDVYATFAAVVQRIPHDGDDDQRRAAMEKAVQTLRARHGLRWVWKTEHANLQAPSKDGLGYVPAGDIEQGRRTCMYIFDTIDGASRKANRAPLVSEAIREAYVLTPAPRDWLAGDTPPPPTPTPQPDSDLAARVAKLEAMVTDLTNGVLKLGETADGADAIARAAMNTAEAVRQRLQEIAPGLTVDQVEAIVRTFRAKGKLYGAVPVDLELKKH
jgi:hypothetical protein